MASSPSALKSFVLASRPKTLIAGISPVVIGTVLAGTVSIPLFTCCLLFSVLIQIGTNYANDYYDFVNGADANRVGPARAVASGWLQPKQMKLAYQAVFAAAFLASIPLVATCGLWALFFVLSSIAFGILYTGGPRPLGYLGLGDILVLIYFGPVAISGTYFVQTHEFPPVLLTLPPGLLSCAILTANNLRDVETDRAAGKNTLVVRFGTTFGQWEYAICIVTASLIPVIYGHYWTLLLLPFAWKQLDVPKTASLLIAYTALFCI